MWIGVVVVVTALGAGVASAGGAPARLSKAQWAAYHTQYTAFTAQTTKSVAKFRSCLSASTGSRNARLMQQCFGNSADLELAATTKLFNLLNGFQKKTSGACDASLNGYLSKVFFWKSSITGVNRAVHSNVANAATIEGQANNARTVYPQVQKAAAAFTAACKPKI
jgi:hypothetical protein